MKPIYKLTRAERRAAAERYSGLRVVVDVRPFRDGDPDTNYTVVGTLLGVAEPNLGNCADLVIVKRGSSLVALSLATVHSIDLP